MFEEMSWLHKLIYRFAYPTYECEKCFVWCPGECYCAKNYYASPGEMMPSVSRELVRKLWSVIAKRGG